MEFEILFSRREGGRRKVGRKGRNEEGREGGKGEKEGGREGRREGGREGGKRGNPSRGRTRRNLSMKLDMMMWVGATNNWPRSRRYGV